MSIVHDGSKVLTSTSIKHTESRAQPRNRRCHAAADRPANAHGNLCRIKQAFCSEGMGYELTFAKDRGQSSADIKLQTQESIPIRHVTALSAR